LDRKSETSIGLECYTPFAYDEISKTPDGIEILGKKFIILYADPELFLNETNYLEYPGGVDETVLQKRDVVVREFFTVSEQEIFHNEIPYLFFYIHHSIPPSCFLRQVPAGP
jgi:hypothetical protein